MAHISAPLPLPASSESSKEEPEGMSAQESGTKCKFQDEFTDYTKRLRRFFLDNQESRDLSVLFRERSVNGGLARTELRSLCWKVMLGVLPENSVGLESWSKAIAESREKYRKLKNTHIIDPTKVEGDAILNNPLSTVENTAWAQYHKDQDLLEEICKDLERLYPTGCGDMFVSDKDTFEVLKTVLFLWSKLNPEISYRQGMHEVAAPFLYVLKQESLLRPQNVSLTGEDLVMYTFVDEAYLEHDLYSLFENLMYEIKPLYEVTKRGGSPSPETTPVVKLSSLIQDKLLRRANPELCLHLSTLEVEPQLYTLRWLRLLFGREFDIDSVLQLWDYLFLFSLKGGLLPSKPENPTGILRPLAFLAVALLVHLGPLLFQKDYSQTLQILMKLPGIKAVGRLITHAEQLQETGFVGAPNTTTTTKVIVNAVAEDTAQDNPPQILSRNGNGARDFLDGSKAFVTKNLRGLVNTRFLSRETSEASSEAVPRLFSQNGAGTATKTGSVQTRMGSKLSNLIRQLEEKLSSDVVADQSKIGTILAEMKCVRDVLLQRITEEDVYN